jgi:hypothetical protein
MSGYYTIHSKGLRAPCLFFGQTALPGRWYNPLYQKRKKSSSIFGQRQKSLLRSPLKRFICKLCTTLSTQFVDKFLARGARGESCAPRAMRPPAQSS